TDTARKTASNSDTHPRSSWRAAPPLSCPCAVLGIARRILLIRARRRFWVGAAYDAVRLQDKREQDKHALGGQLDTVLFAHRCRAVRVHQTSGDEPLLGPLRLGGVLGVLGSLPPFIVEVGAPLPVRRGFGAIGKLGRD